MNYYVEFIYVDHESDTSAPLERTIVTAESKDDAGRKFFESGDMAGCYIKDIVPIVW